ncbi:MAG: MerR family transcriptional regulator [Deinococcota bacterium]
MTPAITTSLLRIGDFATLSRVSVKMLRHYDTLGLLKPVWVDPESHYRYYSVEQLPRLHQLVALKDLGFNLAQIARLLAGGLDDNQILTLLQAREAELQADITSQQHQLMNLRSHIARFDIEQLDTEQLDAERLDVGRSDPSLDDAVILRGVNTISVASLELAPTADVSEGFVRLESYVSKYHARASSAPLLRYLDTDTLELCVPLSRSITGTDVIQITRLPAIQAASTLHQGGYDNMAEAYSRLTAWLELHNYQLAGPLREVYLRFSAEPIEDQLPAAFLASTSNDYLTELQLPIHMLTS